MNQNPYMTNQPPQQFPPQPQQAPTPPKKKWSTANKIVAGVLVGLVTIGIMSSCVSSGDKDEATTPPATTAAPETTAPETKEKEDTPTPSPEAEDTPAIDLYKLGETHTFDYEGTGNFEVTVVEAETGVKSEGYTFTFVYVEVCNYTNQDLDVPFDVWGAMSDKNMDVIKTPVPITDDENFWSSGVIESDSCAEGIIAFVEEGNPLNIILFAAEGGRYGAWDIR